MILARQPFPRSVTDVQGIGINSGLLRNCFETNKERQA